jgi:hypothetical protein
VLAKKPSKRLVSGTDNSKENVLNATDLKQESNIQKETIAKAIVENVNIESGLPFVFFIQ